MMRMHPKAPSIMLRRSSIGNVAMEGPPSIGRRVALDASSSMVISDVVRFACGTQGWARKRALTDSLSKTLGAQERKLPHGMYEDLPGPDELATV